MIGALGFHQGDRARQRPPIAGPVQRKAHETRSHCIGVLGGELVLVEDGGETALKAGDCAACHTLAYIPMNSPFLNAAGWDATVKKMINALKAEKESLMIEMNAQFNNVQMRSPASADASPASEALRHHFQRCAWINVDRDDKPNEDG